MLPNLQPTKRVTLKPVLANEHEIFCRNLKNGNIQAGRLISPANAEASWLGGEYG